MRYLLAGGGTGGHIFPLLATAAELRKVDPATEVTFVVSAKEEELERVRRAGYDCLALAAKPLAGGALGRRIRNALGLPAQIFRAWQILGQVRPDAVLGLGGYVAGPVVLAAKLRAIPSAIIEPNAVAGYANVVLAYFCRKIFIAFPTAAREFPPSKVVESGNPLRPEIARGADRPRAERPFTVLVFGGSQGANRLNVALTGALPLLAEQRDQLFFIHQTGRKDQEWVKEMYRRAGFQAEVVPFVEEMGQAYARSHLVISRSGSSVLEIAAAGLPSILVPYPHAARRHQQANAEHLVRGGAAILVADEEANAGRIAELIRTLFADGGQRQKMAAAARRLAKPAAAAEIARALFSLAKGEPC
jgi:UDP-N-acetylglucosamine--N-acetylmuramyl-(pentapeptide) pyrophosphoryl-undecaprenol N-acetylglucosamine transferase